MTTYVRSQVLVAHLQSAQVDPDQEQDARQEAAGQYWGHAGYIHWGGNIKRFIARYKVKPFSFTVGCALL